jgi:hypothetical protein
LLCIHHTPNRRGEEGRGGGGDKKTYQPGHLLFLLASVAVAVASTVLAVVVLVVLIVVAVPWAVAVAVAVAVSLAVAVARALAFLPIGLVGLLAGSRGG